MRPDDSGYSRRDFMRAAAGAACAGAAVESPSTYAAAVLEPAPARSRVVLARDAAVFDAAGRVNAAVVQRMLDAGVASLMETDCAMAWRRIAGPGDIVGVKTNRWEHLPTPAPVEDAIARRIAEAGVSSNAIAVDDAGVRTNPVFRNATALVNVRPMRTHPWAGVATLVQNYLAFAECPAQWHRDDCADAAGVWDLPEVRGKTRLNVLVLFAPLFHGTAPYHFDARYTWAYNGMILGVDPVACDMVGLRILEAKRREYFGRDVPFPVPPAHLRAASEKYRLGEADFARINLVRIGPSDDSLV